MNSIEGIQNIEPQTPTKPISRFEELPFWKRGITIATVGLSALAASCSGNTGNEPTTSVPPPTTIETTIPTTTTEAPTTTTEAPTTTTSTTEAPPVTIPENTCYPVGYDLPPIDISKLPEDITEPTGRVLQNGKDLSLGLFETKVYQSVYDDARLINGRVIRCYEENYSDYYHAGDTTILIADLVVGKYKDGTPIIRKVTFGRPGVDVSEDVWFFSGEEFEIGEIDPHLYYPVSEYKRLLEARLVPGSQIGIIVRTGEANWEFTEEELQQMFNSCTDGFKSYPNLDTVSYCESLFESSKYNAKNKNLVDALSQSTVSLENELPENELIWASGVFFFVP